MLEYEDIIRDPVHGYIYITKLEEAVINSPFFQRLRLIKQTPGASWVYPGANHCRLEHSLGVMHLAGKLATKLLHRDERWREELSEEEKKKLIQKVRLVGLLHDVGHGPFSHVFEEFLNNIGSKVNHEDIGEVIVKQKANNVVIQNSQDVQLSEQDVEEITDWLRERRYGLGSVVTESINGDILDYLVRDAHHTGTVEYGWVDIDRIIENMTLIRLLDDEKETLDAVGTIILRENPERKKSDNLILTIDERAIIAVESFFISRLEMYKAVYYHRTVRAIEKGIADSIEEIVDEVAGLKMFKNLSQAGDLSGPGESGGSKLDDFLCLNDYSVLGKILEKNCDEFNKILQRKQRRMALEKPEAVTSDELAEYPRRLGRRKSIEKEISERLSKEGLQVKITLDVPFPLLPVRVGKVYITYRQGGNNMVSTIMNYGKLPEKHVAPILKVMIERDMLRMIEQKVFADTDDDTILGKVGEIAQEILGGGGVSPPHI